jgi:hypothetical protein
MPWNPEAPVLILAIHEGGLIREIYLVISIGEIGRLRNVAL